jgi:hypothetical protein
VVVVTPGIHLRWLPGARIEFPYRERTLDAEFGTGPSGPMSGLVGGSRGSFGVMTDERPLTGISKRPPGGGGTERGRDMVCMQIRLLLAITHRRRDTS